MASTLAPARPAAGELPGRGSPWLVLASVVLLLVGAVGLVLSPAPGDSTGPGDTAGPARTAPVPQPWAGDVLAAAELSGIPPEVVAAQLDVESRWDPRAVSPAGAQGLAQFMPHTWREFGHGSPFDPHDAIRAQGRYLRELRRAVAVLRPASEREEIDLVLAAYNAGPSAVLQHGGVPPIEETRHYVARIRQLAATRYAGLRG